MAGFIPPKLDFEPKAEDLVYKPHQFKPKRELPTLEKVGDWRTDANLELADRGDYPGPGPEHWLHQLAALKRAEGREYFAYLMEMGTGKTRVITDEWARMVREGECRDLLVVAPAGSYRNWERELREFLDEDIAERALIRTWISGGSRSNMRAITGMLGNRDPARPRVFLVNVEAFSRVDRAAEAAKEFLSRQHAMMAVDESTVIRNMKSNRTEVVHDLGHSAQFRRIATGLVSPRSPMDLYAQYFFLDWKILRQRSFYGFRHRYAILKKMPVGQMMRDKRTGALKKREVDVIVGHQNLDELRDLILPHSFRVLKEDCLDLPPKIYQTRTVELTDQQRNMVKQLREEAQAHIAGEDWVYATSLLTRAIRHQQILCGFVEDEQGQGHEVKSNRISALLDVLSEHDGSAIIWAPFVKSLRQITKKLKEEYGDDSTVTYWGETSSDKRVEAIDRFQAGDARFFVGHPAAAGRGITLTRASLVVYYANTPDLEHRMQSEDRAHRGGLRHPVTYVDLIVPGTLDEKWVEALRNKMDVASLLQGESAREWLI